MRVQFLAAAFPVVFAIGTTGGYAQSSGTLADVLLGLLGRSVGMPSPATLADGTPLPGNPHDAHFLPALGQTSAGFALNQSIATQLNTFPIGRSSGGFTYERNPTTGALERSSGNFGPSFAERALTTGKAGKVSLGFTYQRVAYDRFEGIGLDSGDVNFILQHNDCCGGASTPLNPGFEGDLVALTANLSISTNTFALFADVGITDRWDAGFILPVVRTRLDARVDARVERLATSNPRFEIVHRFDTSVPGVSPDGSAFSFSDGGTRTGLGDIVLRTKYRAIEAPGGGLAVGLDVRLPSGHSDDLLGTGATQWRPSLIYSGEYGRVSPHVNVAYVASSGGPRNPLDRIKSQLPFSDDRCGTQANCGTLTQQQITRLLEVPDEIAYTAGLVINVQPKLSVGADLIGRTFRDVSRFSSQEQSFSFRPQGAPATTPLQTVTRNTVDLRPGSDRLTQLVGNVGLKYNFADRWLLNANVLFPITDQGLRIKVTPVIGFDYAF